MKETTNKLIFNLFLDMRKKELNKQQRAALLAKYIDDNKISQRELARQLGIPKSTIGDWLLLNRIPPKQYKQYIKDGMSETDIYRMLRDNTRAGAQEFDILLFKREVKKSILRYNSLIRYGKDIDTELYDDIKELINTLNRVLIHKERNL